MKIVYAATALRSTQKTGRRLAASPGDGMRPDQGLADLEDFRHSAVPSYGKTIHRKFRATGWAPGRRQRLPVLAVEARQDLRVGQRGFRTSTPAGVRQRRGYSTTR
jgi:hypothetical protein